LRVNKYSLRDDGPRQDYNACHATNAHHKLEKKILFPRNDRDWVFRPCIFREGKLRLARQTLQNKI